MEKTNFQPIQDIGFTGLIEKISGFKGIKRKEILMGIGDDAAVFSGDAGKQYSITSEIFLEGVHFDLTYHPLQHLAYKLVTASVSDIYAMNMQPFQLLISVAIPNKYSVQMVEQFFQGADQACKDYEMELSGGDTTASHQLLAVSLTAIGVGEREKIVYRNGAKPNDLLCVTGDLGAAIAGLRILMREKNEWKEGNDQNFRPDLQEYEYVVKRQLRPPARKDVVELFDREHIRPNSLTDITQGLVAAIRNIAKSSSLGAEIYLPAIPISLETRRVADEMKEDVDKYAFYGGEDFELLFSLPETNLKKLEKHFNDFTVIGRLTSERKDLQINTGEEQTIEIEI